MIGNIVVIGSKDLSSILRIQLKMSMKRLRNKEKVHSLVNTLSKKGIVLMAVDFDQTLISFHSGGIWKDSIDKLAEYVRPCMKDLMDVAIERGLHVCIVTYFMQSWVIKELLKKLFGRHHLIIKPEEIILFDDDKGNVEKALEFGHWAVEVKEDISYDSFEEFAWQLGRKPSSKKNNWSNYGDSSMSVFLLGTAWKNANTNTSDGKAGFGHSAKATGGYLLMLISETEQQVTDILLYIHTAVKDTDSK
ncbi:hypothetical protein KUTeg_010045, partial [Tegillarca granosa]